jgi:hypothetical protein
MTATGFSANTLNLIGGINVYSLQIDGVAILPNGQAPSCISGPGTNTFWGTNTGNTNYIF